jgi:hypothetical protein
MKSSSTGISISAFIFCGFVSFIVGFIVGTSIFGGSILVFASIEGTY